MPALTFLNQPKPLLPQVIAFLTEGWNGGLLDLSGTALVLPTQESRRRLHEALVREAAAHDSALLPPVWMLPMHLTESEKGKGQGIAPASLEQLSWITILRSMSEEERRGLFPRRVPVMDVSRASELAATIKRLRGELAQAGMSLADAAMRRPEDPRWKVLLLLESRYLKLIAGTGATEHTEAQLAGIASPRLPSRVHRLIIASVPDLPKAYDLMIPRLEAQGNPVEILVYDPLGKGGDFFDSLGRPEKRWAEEPIEIEQSGIHLCLDRAEEAEKASTLVRASGGTGATCAVAVTTVDLARGVKEGLEAEGLNAFNPAGQPLDTMSMGRLLKFLLDLLHEGDFRSALQVLRHPEAQRWLDLDPARDLKLLDELQNQLIPSSLPDLLARWPLADEESKSAALAKLRNSLEKLLGLVRKLASHRGGEPLLSALREIYGPLDLAAIAGGRESVECIREWLSGAEALSGELNPEEILSLLIASLKSTLCTGEKKPGSLELPGWLELLWEDAPHLIITGMNDGLVPEMRQGDPFLSESLRSEWNLPSDASRLHRDSYLLLSLLAARPRKHGRVDLLLARLDNNGAFLKPSRLLLRCRNAEDLPARVTDLFRELRPREGAGWHAAWRLVPDTAEKKPLPCSLSASALKEYLSCPARLFLKRQMGLRATSFGMEEADAGTFGELHHETWSDFGSDPALRKLSDPEAIERALIALWMKRFAEHYGETPLFPLLYQREAGIRRLRAAARTQATAREEGWEIVACERTFQNFQIEGIPGISFSGRIDRIDRRHNPDGSLSWRIIDYKTSAATPDAAHYDIIRKRDTSISFPGHEVFTHDLKKKPYHWIDLQLPLYRLFLLSEMARGSSEVLGLENLKPGSLECVYFLLPTKLADTRIVLFEGFTGWEESARDCIAGVVAAIQAGIFWPPRQPKYDDFEHLFFDRMEAPPGSGQQTIDPEPLRKGVNR